MLPVKVMKPLSEGAVCELSAGVAGAVVAGVVVVVVITGAVVV